MSHEIKPEFWPDVPAHERPKKLFVEQSIPVVDAAVFESKGWTIIDVRMLPNSSDADRAETVKALLEGIRVGTIEPDPKRLKFLELEAAVYGLKNSKGASTAKKDETDTDDIEKLLNFRSPRAFRGTWNFTNNMPESAAQSPAQIKPKGRLVGAKTVNDKPGYQSRRQKRMQNLQQLLETDKDSDI